VGGAEARWVKRVGGVWWVVAARSVGEGGGVGGVRWREKGLWEGTV